MTCRDTVNARVEGTEGSTRCTPHGVVVGPDAYTREKFATETMGDVGRPVYAKHDWHELCSGANRKGLGINGERRRWERHADTPFKIEI